MLYLYNLEYNVTDSNGKILSTHHVGMFNDEADIEFKKKDILSENKNKNIIFNIFIINDLLR